MLTRKLEKNSLYFFRWDCDKFAFASQNSYLILKII
jgi:hypothetical protein